MKAIIPVAGMGTRLRPHTYTTPKALFQVAGRPILAYILDEVVRLGIGEVVLVVGHLGDKIVEYVRGEYPHLDLYAVQQEEQLGLGHAVYLTRKYVEGGPALIIYGDTIFEGDLRDALKGNADGRIGVKPVDDPGRFGVVVVEGGRIVRLVEKPSEFVSDLAIAGVNFVRNTPLLFESLEAIVNGGRRTKGEYQLTDAFQEMVDRGARLEPFPVENWFDCGKPESLLQTNRHLLSKRGDAPEIPGSVVLPPSFVAPTAKIKNSIIGPYASVAEGACIEESIVRNSIVGEGAFVRGCLLEESIVGDRARVLGTYQRLNVGDSSEVSLGGS
ncbi:MAG: nucleotidyl transferase [Candidatus Latescibacterota bacterium]|nr:MAG: nucleotidyl transferase [Candidatus Latescibacterota bacterium]